MKINKILSLTTALLFIVMITINALANILPINNYNTGELSDLIPNLFVPAGITFSIWGVIYTLLLILTIYNVYLNFKDGLNLRRFNLIISINFILNSLWIICWHYRLVGVSLLIILCILLSLILLDKEVRDKKLSKVHKIYPFAINIYFGWASVATIANFTAFFVEKGWSGLPLSQDIWTILVLIVGGVIAMLKICLHKNIPFALVVVWAYIGVIIKRNTYEPIYTNIILTAYIVIGIIFVASIIKLIKSKS